MLVRDFCVLLDTLACAQRNKSLIMNDHARSRIKCVHGVVVVVAAYKQLQAKALVRAVLAHRSHRDRIARLVDAAIPGVAVYVEAVVVVDPVADVARNALEETRQKHELEDMTCWKYN